MIRLVFVLTTPSVHIKQQNNAAYSYVSTKQQECYYFLPVGVHMMLASGKGGHQDHIFETTMIVVWSLA